MAGRTRRRGRGFGSWAPVLLFFSAPAAQAKGRAAAEFLSEPLGARAAAMGGAYSAVVDDAGAVQWNAAALAALSGPSVLLMRQAGLASSALNDGAYGQPLGDRWGAGLALRYRTAGSLVQRDDFGTEVGRLTPSDMAVSLAAARRQGPLAVGAAVKAVRSTIQDTARATAGDAGVLWIGDGWRAALTAANVGGKIRYGTAGEDLPRTFRFGLAAGVGGRWVLGLDAAAPLGGDPFLSAGAESVLVKTASTSLSLRAGYATRSPGGAERLAGAAFGLGFGAGGLSFDYAFLPAGDAGDAHLLSMTWRFSLPTETKPPARKAGVSTPKRAAPKRPAPPSNGRRPAAPQRRRPGPV